MIISGFLERSMYLICAILRILCFIFFLNPFLAHAIDISDTPLDVQINAAPANLMFILDNSASMDAEFMTSDTKGLFGGCCYLFPDSAYTPLPDHFYGSGRALDTDQRCQWQSQWCIANSIYYNPLISYHPWPSTDTHIFEPADRNRPLSNPAIDGSRAPRLNLSGLFALVNNGDSVVRILNAHYYVLDDTNGNGIADNQETIYLVAWQDNDEDGLLDVSGDLRQDRRIYFRLSDDGDGCVEPNELISVTNESELRRIRPAHLNAQGQFVGFKTDAEDLQNFANWISYYRRRELAAKAAAADLISSLQNIHIGLYALNHAPRIPVQPVRLLAGSQNTANRTDRADDLLDALYEMELFESTHLRRALDQVGRYFHQDLSHELGPSPFQSAESGGGCQSALAVIVSDGFSNGQFTGIGNCDGSYNSPFKDSWGDTLADVAMHYHEIDLAPLLPDLLPRSACDDTRHQRMTTHCICLGTQGIIDIQDIDGDGRPDNPGYQQDPCFKNPRTPHPQWPAPETDGISGIDDLWHAAVNGRGRFTGFVNSFILKDVSKTFANDIGHPIVASSTPANKDYISDDSICYVTRYRADEWNGELLAVSIHQLEKLHENENTECLWNAAERLEQPGINWDTRRIITYGGRGREPDGILFRYPDLSDDQRSVLGSDLINGSPADMSARDVLEYIRGRELDRYRNRAGTLGDIIHSQPVVYGNSIFVGANDGMLHAFDAGSGEERFAYVPNLVFDHLKELSRPDYCGHHRFYVDETATVGEIEVDRYKRRTYLVGGLGKGGKGYYCLLIGSRQRPRQGTHFGDYQQTFSVDEIDSGFSEHDLRRIVQWEYPRAVPSDDNMDNDGDVFIDEEDETDPDMGYSFSRAYAVNANTPEDTYRPVVIFGNGYNSAGGKAVLFILEAETGRILRKIDTGVAKDNGLSTPALIDIDLDRRVDYAYAGDLKGNLWKFDLTSENLEKWAVAYGSDVNADGTIDAGQGDEPRPLFSAIDQPITARPDIMRMRCAREAGAPGYMVVFGTGKYLGASDRFDLSRQTIYGLWDYGDNGDDDEHLGYLIDRTTGRLSSGLCLVPQHVTSQLTKEGRQYREISTIDFDYRLRKDPDNGNGANTMGNQWEPDPELVAGWFLDFPVQPDHLAIPGERVVSRAIMRGGNVMMVSFAPNDEPCVSGGNSWVYLLNGCTGQAPLDESNEPELPWSPEFKISGDIWIAKKADRMMSDQMLAVGTNGTFLMQEFSGELTGKFYWRQNLNKGQ